MDPSFGLALRFEAERFQAHSLYWLLSTSVREKSHLALITILFLSVRGNSAIDPGRESFSSTRENTEIWVADHQERHAQAA
jgi:hypothetical protein